MADVAETIEDSGRRIGHHAWMEMRLFEIVGRWSGTVPDPRARALFGSQSHHHAWHAELWHALLPALPHLPAAALVAPDQADAETIAALDALDEAERGDTDGDAASNATGNATIARLTALYRVAIPRLVAGYTDHLAHTTVVTDGPIRRALRLALADLAADRTEGDELLDHLGTAPPA